MRLLFCHNRYEIRSGEDSAFDVARGLLERAGHEVLTVVRDNRTIRDASVAARLRLGAAAVYSRSAAREIRQVVERARPAAALVQNVFPLLSPSIYRTLQAAAVPVVQLVFNYRLLCLNGQFFTQGEICERCRGGNYLHGVARRCFRQSYTQSAVYAASLGLHRAWGTWARAVRYFVVPDRFLGQKLVEGGFPEERIRTVSNPFDVDGYVPTYEGDGRVLFVGRWIRPKGIFTLLDAAMRTRVPIAIVGDGEDAAAVRAHPAVASGRVTVIGPAYGEAMRELLGLAAALVVPSEWYDNLPMIVCQAFAQGTPVIASRIDGIPEYVRDGESGLLFPPGDVGALAAAMERLTGDEGLRLSLAHGARRTAERLFRPERWLGAMEAILGEAAAG